MKKTISVILSLVMTVTFLCSSMPVFAEESETTTAEQMPTIENDISINGTNSFGNLLSDKLTAETDKQEENNGYNVFSAEVTGNTVVVEYEALEECTALAAIYDEAGEIMLASGNTEVSPENDTAEITIETDGMPEYFYLRVYLIDSEDLSPMCTAYQSPNYTKEMQEFFAKTVEDFPEDRVYNLDEDDTNNFAVYGENVIRLDNSDNVNIFTTVDEENEYYVIENADETVLNLGHDDIFVYEQEDGMLLIVDVDTITIDGTTAVITGQDTSMEDVFQYVKIDTTKNEPEPTPEPQMLPMPFEDGLKRAIDIDKSASGSAEWSFLDVSVAGNEDVKINGSVKVELKGALKLYISLSHSYIEFKVDLTGTFSITATGKLKFSKPLAKKIEFKFLDAVEVSMTPSFIIEATGKISLEGTIKGTIQLTADTDKGINSKTSLKFSAELKAEVTVFIGLSFEPKIDILNKKFVDAKMKARAGGEFKAKLYNKEETSSKKHDCAVCLEGKIYAKAEISASVKLANNENWKFELKPIVEQVKICDFYYSFDNNEWGFGTCPNLVYKVTVTVKDKDGNAVKDADVTISGSGSTINAKTNSKGKCEVFLKSGKYTITAEYGGKKASKKDSVKDDTKTIELVIDTEPTTTTTTNVTTETQTTSTDTTTTITVTTTEAEPEGTIVESGKCGDNVKYDLYDNGTLVIYGAGDMYDFVRYSSPFYNKYSKIKNTIIKNGVTKIGDFAFCDCPILSSITIPDGVTKIGDFAFCDCWSLTSITIPDGVTIIANSAFYECLSLTSITIPDSVTDIGNDAFSECKNLTSINIPDSVTDIGNYAFHGCSSLTSINIPDGVTSIETGTFGCCSSLTSITIPKSATKIGGAAFVDCLGLTDIYYTGTEEQWSCIYIDWMYNGELRNATIHYNYTPETPNTASFIPNQIKINAPRETSPFTALDPDLIYNVYLFNTLDTENLIAPENLLYVMQFRADSDGNIDTSAIPLDEYEDAVISVVGMKLPDEPIEDDPSEDDPPVTTEPTTTTTTTTESTTTTTATTTTESTTTNTTTIEPTTTVSTTTKATTTTEESTTKSTTTTAEATTENPTTTATSTTPVETITVALGDVNEDGTVDASDASRVLAEYANLSTGGTGTLTGDLKTAADVNGDDVIDASDASLILAFYAYVSTGGDIADMAEWLVMQK